ncbi:MAG: GGDEF domain-containing protein [Kangiellaceae bacterium]|jgi:diguanylate cyclase (GGDEF)-like protein|nr:GGDEF domain-containing protein [Kangiellaceae bacterium]
MSRSTFLLDNISRITSHRDSELLAFSLLKSIKEMLSPLSACIIKLDENEQPILEIGIRGEQYAVKDELTLPDNVKTAIEYMNSLSLQSYATQEAETGFYFHLLNHNRKSSDFLYMELEKNLSKEQIHVLSGILSIYANYLSLLIESQMDSLTGLQNRRSFDDKISKIFNYHDIVAVKVDNDRRASSSTKHYWLAVIDIDNFKLINDTYGHLYGDEILIVMGQKMKACFRQTDMKFRFGGEEFIVILDCPTFEDCKAKLNEFRLAIEQAVFPNKDTVTVSIGAVELRPDVFHVTLIDQADKALYFSKEHGKNQVTFYDELVERGEITEAEVDEGEVQLF